MRFCGSGYGRRSQRSRPSIGLFLIVSWAGLWLALPPHGPRDRPVRPVCSSWRPAPCRSCACACRARTTGCAGSTARSGLRTGRRPPWPTRWRPRKAIRGRSRCGAPMSSGRCAPRASFKAGLPDAAAGGARSDGAARAGADPAGRDLLRRRRRARPAHHRGVRLAGRGPGANFRVDAWVTPPPYTGAAAGDPAGPAPRRAGAGRPGAAGVGAGRQRAGDPRDRQARSLEISCERRPRGGQPRRRRRRRRPAPRSSASPSRTRAASRCAASATTT